MIDFKLSVVNGRMVMSHEVADSFLNNIILSIYIRKGSFFQANDFGSLLYRIKKITDNNVKLARDYIMAALKWMIDTGRMTDLVVETEADLANNAIRFLVSCRKKTGQDIKFNSFYSVV
jgi:phage gp46-like protein